ncbi:MAG TPA: VWA domain-containing protein [Blastocatellia bacterium]|nr:VWA domain-containing protein [Blastocatellia bacterium]
MKLHRMVVLSFSVILALHACLFATAQSPNNAPERGKNGRVLERKLAGPERDGLRKQKTDSLRIQPADDRPVTSSAGTVGIQPGFGDSTRGDSENVRLAVDLVVLDAQVIQQKTGRVAGNLKKEDFVVAEDGVRQQVTHFSQDTLPLSVILLVDRGGCLDPFSEKVRHATLEALQRLRPQDEVALMSFANSSELVEGFGRGKDRILAALDHLPPHDENAQHCFNRALYDASAYMRQAGNPDGRRVIIVISALTTFLDCPGTSPQEARMAILESGSVICGIIPKTAGQQMENGIMTAVAGIGGMFKAKSSNLKQIADETGGEVLTDKPENLDRTFNDLIDHLRTRYTLGFVSTNMKRDGSFRKLKVELAHPPTRPEDKLVVKTKRGYIAAKTVSRLK